MMDINDIVNLLVQFQTAIVGLIGFTGVILTLIVNAQIARNLQRRATEHEREVLRGSLVSELKNIRESFRSKVMSLDEDRGERGYFGTANDPMTDIYDASLTRLGLLSSEHCEKIISTYLTVKEFHVRLRSLGDLTPDKGEIRVETKKAETIRQLVNAVLPIINTTIASLDSANASSFAGRGADEVQKRNLSSA